MTIEDAHSDCVGLERRPAQARSRARLADIQRAAIAIFARDGIGPARITDIATRANIPASSLYDYFSSKEELAQSTLVSGLTRFFSEMGARAATFTSAREFLEAYLNLTIENSWQHPDWARVYHLEVWPSAIAAEGGVRQAILSYREVLIKILSAGGTIGEWSVQRNRDDTVLILTGSLHQLVLAWLLYKQPSDIKRAAGPLIRRLMRLVEMD